MELIRVLSETDHGLYVVKEEVWRFGKDESSEVTMVVAYNPEGKYIGEPHVAKYLCDKMGIAPTVRDPSLSVCTIGFSEKLQKWFGWSHRAIFGFQPGDVVKEGDATCDYLPIGFKAKTWLDARRMADAFAQSVSSKREMGLASEAMWQDSLRQGLDTVFGLQSS